MKPSCSQMFALVLVAASISCTHEVEASVKEGSLARAFPLAAAETGVPAELLMAIGWVETRWQVPTVIVIDEEHGRSAQGLMGLIDRPDLPYLELGARLIGADAADVREDGALNVHAAAHVLRKLALAADGALPREIPGGGLAGWRDTLAQYGAGRDVEAGAIYADEVLRVLDSGATGTASTGEQLVLEGRGKSGQQKAQALVGDSQYAITFLAAREGFFTRGRSHAIDRVVIHTTEGSYAGAISWFRSPNNPYQTSAHYVIRSSDGEITQMVREQDTAHHVFNWNSRSIGIEHEAVSAQPQWFTEAMYRSSAALVREVCLRYGIPMDRAHIVGHAEVPGNDHSDPGVHWDWSYFMALVTDGEAVPPPQSACGDLDYAGVCDGAVLRWCESGAPRNHDCASEGQSCGWQDDATGNNCVDGPPPPAPPPAPSAPPAGDACDGLDYAGACEGSVVNWCENGAPRSFDCASTGQTCGWQDDDVGNNCTAPAPVDPCNGETYAGRCDGDTLVWCEDEVVRAYTCANSCGWQSDDVGNNCL